MNRNATNPHGNGATPGRGRVRVSCFCIAISLVALCAVLAPITRAAQEPTPAESATNTQLPFADPQFWVVTLAALCAGAWLLRRVLPLSLFSKHRTRSSTRATLTVGGEPVEVKRKPERKCH